MIVLNKPNLRGENDKEKIEELRRYLFTLVDDLQYALQYLESKINNTATSSVSTLSLRKSTGEEENVEETAEEVAEENTEENTEVEAPEAITEEIMEETANV